MGLKRYFSDYNFLWDLKIDCFKVVFCGGSPLPHTHAGCRRQSWRTITQDQLLRTIVLASASSFYHAQSLQCDCQYLQWKGGRWNCSAGVASLKIGRLDKCLVLPTCQGDPGGGSKVTSRETSGQPSLQTRRTSWIIVCISCLIPRFDLWFTACPKVLSFLLLQKSYFTLRRSGLAAWA